MIKKTSNIKTHVCGMKRAACGKKRAALTERDLRTIKRAERIENMLLNRMDANVLKGMIKARFEAPMMHPMTELSNLMSDWIKTID
jgi:hypothetical protein